MLFIGDYVHTLLARLQEEYPEVCARACVEFYMGIAHMHAQTRDLG